MSELRGISTFEVPLYWHRIAELLLPVIDLPGVDNTLEDVRHFLHTGAMQAWHVDWKTIVVTTITPYGANPQQPTKRVCQIVYCAGTDMPAWLDDVVEHLSRWARTQGCQKLRITGRKGWTKVLPDFVETCVTLELDVCK